MSNNRFSLLHLFSHDTAFIELWIHFHGFLYVSHQYNTLTYFCIWLLEMLRTVICIPTFLIVAFNKNFLFFDLHISFKYLKFCKREALFKRKDFYCSIWNVGGVVFLKIRRSQNKTCWERVIQKTSNRSLEQKCDTEKGNTHKGCQVPSTLLKDLSSWSKSNASKHTAALKMH